MNSLLPLLPWLISMIVLMACSAFFSASEAALFFLRPRDRKAMADGTPAQRVAAGLMEDPDRLLSAVLFWNLVINITYFAISSVCTLQLERTEELGQTWAVGFAAVSVLAVIFFCEMLPKSIAVLQPRRLAEMVAIPLSWAVRVIDPVMPMLKAVNIVSRRLLIPRLQQEDYLHSTDLERAIRVSGKDEALIKQEQAVLHNIVRLSEIRADEWMRPRTQFDAYSPPVSLADLEGKLPRSGYMLITEPDSDEIEKAIRLDNLFSFPGEEIERLAEPVLYMPWCSTVADALEKMTQREREVCVIVNEFGDSIGILTIEDILETVFHYSPSRSMRLLDINPMHEIEPGRWAVSGMMSLRLLARQLDLEIPETHSITVAGMVQEQMQRLAEPGDLVEWGPLNLLVKESPQRGNILLELTLDLDREVEP
ncbi:MAG: hemolysin family protein [Planctomycetota bacterium]